MADPNIPIQTLANAAFIDRVRQLQTRALNRLSSGNQIVVPSDDPTGIGLVEKMAAQSKRVDAASVNVQNALSLTQSMDSFLNGMGKLVTRMSELAQFATDPSKNDADRALYRTEFTQLQLQLRNTIGGTTTEIGGTQGIDKPIGTFNGSVLFGTNPSGMLVTIGKSAVDRLTIPEMNLRTGAVLSVISQDSAGDFSLDIADPGAFATMVAAMEQLGSSRADLGGVAGRLDLIASSLTSESEGLTRSISNRRDVDIASETTRLAKYTILNDASTAMLAQASAAPKAILQLLSR